MCLPINFLCMLLIFFKALPIYVCLCVCVCTYTCFPAFGAKATNGLTLQQWEDKQ